MNVQKQLGRAFVLGVTSLFTWQCMAQSVSPPSGTPLSRESVSIRVSTTTPFALGRESVTLVNNKLTVTMRSIENTPDAGPAPRANDVPASSADVFLGKLPQGSYTVDVLFQYRPSGTMGYVGTTQFSVADDSAALSSAFPAYDFTDLWWNPNESGWGISIHVKRNRLFAAWFVYDPSGQPTWYTLQSGSWEAPNRYVGRIYVTHSDPNAGLGPLTSMTFADVGSGTLTFDGSSKAYFEFTVSGIQRNKNIVRQVF